MSTAPREVYYHQSVRAPICTPIQSNNKLKLIVYISLALCGALALSVTFGNKFDVSQEKFRGQPRRRAAREAAATSDGFKDPFPERPRIQTRNGHLIIEASQDKNIDFRTSGSRGTITINGHKIDQLLNVTKALEKSTQFGSGSNGADQYEVVLRNLFASHERFAKIERTVDDLKRQVSKLKSQAGKLSKKITDKSRQLSQVSKQQDTLLTKLKRNDCFDSDSGQPVCKNGATCLDTYDGFKCLCPATYEGPTCELDVDECAKFRGTDLGCQNGARCINLAGGYRCECTSQYHGVHCTEQQSSCAMSSSRSLCAQGKCVDLAHQDANQARYQCICDQGWTTDGINPACVIDINECLAGQQQSAVAGNASSGSLQSVSLPWSNSLMAAYPCSQSPFVECTNLPGSFQCGPCPPGYSGNGRVCRPVDLCLQNNGGCSIQPLVECISVQGSRRCGACPPGYTGDGVVCSRMSACSADFNGGCHPMAKCRELPAVSLQARLCVCQYPFTGDGIGPSGCKRAGNATDDELLPMVESAQDDCNPSRCLHGAQCVRTDSSFECICPLGWAGRLCDERASVCGGDFSVGAGVVKFPLDDSFDDLVKLVTSQPTTDGGRHYSCKWSIAVAGNMTVKLVLSELANKVSTSKKIRMFLSNSSSTASNSHSVLEPPACLEHLDVRQLIELDWRLIGRFCTAASATGSLKLTSLPLLSSGQQREVVLHAESNRVRLEYSFSPTRTQFGEPSLSFRLNWSQVEPPCGGELPVADSGSVASPGFPDFYRPGIECRYLIRVPAGKLIRVQLGDLNLLAPPTKAIESSSCADSLTLLDGSVGADRPVLFRHCANKVTLMGKSQADSMPSRPIVTSSSSAELILVSQLSSAWPLMRPREKRGFYLTYSSEQSQPGCGGLFTKPAATIKSSDYQAAQLVAGSQDDSQLALTLADYISAAFNLSEGSSALRSIRMDSTSGKRARDSPFRTRCEYEIRPANQGRNHKISIDSLEMPSKSPIDQTGLDKSSHRNLSCLVSRLKIYDGSQYNSDAASSQRPLRTFCWGGKYDSSMTPMLPIVSSTHSMVVVYESSASLSSASDRPGGFKLQYSTVCRAIYNQPSGQIEAEVSSEVSECIYHIMLPPNNTLNVRLERRQSGEPYQADESCPGQTIFMDGAIGPSKYDLLVAERLLEEYKSGQSSGEQSDTRGSISASSDGPIDNADLGAGGGDGATSSASARASSTSPAPMESSIWDSGVVEHSRSSVHAIKEFDMCKLFGVEIDSLWNHMSLLLRLRPQALESQGQQSLKFQFTATYKAKPTCGGIITDSGGGSLTLGTLWTGQRQGAPGIDDNKPAQRLARPRERRYSPNRTVVQMLRDTSNPEVDDCDWIVKAAPNEMIELEFNVPLVAEIKQRYRDWLSWSRTSYNATGGGGGGSDGNQPEPIAPQSADQAQDYCSQVFVESIELYEPSLDKLSRLCPMDLIASKPSALHWSTETNVVSIKLLHQKIPKPALNEQNQTTPVWPGRKPLNDSKPISVRYEFRELNSAKQCGGKLLYDSGVIRSPRFPFHYPSDARCTWHIQAKPGQQIRLNITKFDLESSLSNCSFDYLNIYNGPSVDSPLVGSFCERQLSNKVIVSHSNFLTLKFKSDKYLTRQGFEIYYDGAETGCGGRLTTPTGQIDSPNYPRAYGHSSDCEWTVEVSLSNRIELTILELDLNYLGGDQQISSPSNGSNSAGTSACPSSEYLEVFDFAGGELQMKSMGRFCSVSAFNKVTLVSRANKMVIVFKSQALDSGRGFSLVYRTYCSSIELAGFRGVIESAGFPSSNYLPSMQCEWRIRAPLGSNLTLVVTDLAIERRSRGENWLPRRDSSTSEACAFDSLRIIPNHAAATTTATATATATATTATTTAPMAKNGLEKSRDWNESLVLCGQYDSLKENEKTIQLSTNQATIRFKTDAANQFGGFRIEWQSLGCGSHQISEVFEPINYHEPSEPLQGPVECFWSLNSAKATESIYFRLDSDMRLQQYSPASLGDPCDEASLTIYDGADEKAPIISKNCDSNKFREESQTSGSVMLVKFFTNGKHSYGRHFSLRAFLWPSRRDGCPTNSYEISAPFNRLAGSRTSPNYPDLYDSSEQFRCRVHFIAQTGRLMFRIEELNIPAGSTQQQSTYDGQQATALESTASGGGGLLAKETCKSSKNLLSIQTESQAEKTEEFYCGQLDPNSPKDLARSTVVVDQEIAESLFTTSQSGLRGRWKINFYRLCGSIVSVDAPLEFASPNYPARPNWPRASMFSGAGEATSSTADSYSIYDPTRAENVCVWRLQKMEYKLHLNIINFIESNGQNGASDCLRVYEGLNLSIRQASFNLTDLDSKYRPRIKICKQQDIKSTSLYYVSTGAELTVLVSGEAIVKFRVKPFENFCGGEFHLSQAEFGSPGFPQPYAPDLDCHYFIIGSPGSRIELNFNTFDLPEGTKNTLDTIDSRDSDDLTSTGNKAAATSDNLGAPNCDNVDYIEIRQLPIGKKLKSIIDNLNSSSTYMFESRMKSILFHSAARRLLDESEPKGSVSKQAANATQAPEVATPSPEQAARQRALKSSALAARRLYELAHVYFLFSGEETHSWSPRSHALSRHFSLEDFYENSRLLGRFCGKELPSLDKKMLRDELLIRFRSHSSAASKSDDIGGSAQGRQTPPPRGFLANFKLEYGGFIQVRTEPRPATTYDELLEAAAAAAATSNDSLDAPVLESSLISSPMYPVKVRYNNSISWQIETRLDHVIQFDLVSLDLGSTKQDCQDTLSIFDGLNPSTRRPLSVYCGQLSFKNLQSRSLTSLFTPNTHSRASSDLLAVNLAHDPKIRSALVRSVRTSANLASVVYNNFQSEGSFLLRYKAVSKAALLKAQQSADNSTGDQPHDMDDLGVALDDIVGDSKAQGRASFDVNLNASETCSKNFRLSLADGSQEVVLTSPNWPKLPPPDTECHWLVSTRDNTDIKLAISPTDTSSLTDDKELRSGMLFSDPDRCLESEAAFKDARRSFVVVHDGGSRLAPIIGRYCLPAAPIQLQSTGSQMLIRYVHADHTEAGSGSQQQAEVSPTELAKSTFKARASVGECGGQYHFLVTSIRDRPASRAKPTYSNNLDCRYYLFASSPDRVLKIYNQSSSIKLSDRPTNENCSVGDYIEIRDLPILSEAQDFSRSSPGRLLGRYCAGRLLENDLETPGSAVMIEFHTDQKNVDKGWKLSIASSVPLENCPRRYRTLNSPDEQFGWFASPNWPHGFSGKRHCGYHLAAPANQSIQVTFVHLQRPQSADGKCRDNLKFLADNEAPIVRYSFGSLDQLESSLSGPLMQKLVQEVPCATPTKQRQLRPPVALVTRGDKLAQMIESPGFKKLSADDYFKLAALAPPEAFVIKTDSHVLMLDYETKDLLPKEGFVAIYRIVDDRRYKCGGEISYTDGQSGGAPTASNLIESAKFGEETSQSDPYIQCDWIVKHARSYSADVGARLGVGFNVIPTANLSQFRVSYVVFETLEIPAAIAGAKLVDEQLSSGQLAKSNEICGLNRLVFTDSYSQYLFACGNLTNLLKWSILEPNVEKISLRTKNLRRVSSQYQPASDGGGDAQASASSPARAALYRGVRARFYEKSCVQLERIIGEAVRFRSHIQYPDGPASYSPGICRWNLYLNGGDYELWFDSVQFRKPENYLNNSSNSKKGAAACDISNPDLDYIELKSSVESDAAVLARFCIYNQQEAKQKSLLLNMRSDLTILFVAGIKQLAAGSESFTDPSKESTAPVIATEVNNNPRPDIFGFDLQLVRIRNESEFCRRDMRQNIYRFIVNKDRYYYNSASGLTSSLTSFLYPKNSHCVVNLNVVEGSRINVSFTGIFDLESSKNCQNDYIQLDDLIPLNSTAAAKLDATTTTAASTTSARTKTTYRSTKKPKANISTSKSPDVGMKNQPSIPELSEKFNVKQLGRWCGNSRPNGYFMSTSNKLRITFHSDERIEGKGFCLEYSAVENGYASRFGDSFFDDE